jgi:hypothetical protein
MKLSVKNANITIDEKEYGTTISGIKPAVECGYELLVMLGSGNNAYSIRINGHGYEITSEIEQIIQKKLEKHHNRKMQMPHKD